LRVEQSKGRKDRNVMLSPETLELLRQWWKARPSKTAEAWELTERELVTLMSSDEHGTIMLIRKHDTSHIVELEDGSRWRIWPGDLAATLQWSSTTDLAVSEIDDELCSHILSDQTGGSRVRAIDAREAWPVEQVRRSLKQG
jgi:integrase